MAEHEITAREFQRNYGDMRRRALLRPVVITNHGKRDLVVLSAEAFDRLDMPTAMRAGDLDDEARAALAEPFVGHGGPDGLDAASARRLVSDDGKAGV